MCVCVSSLVEGLRIIINWETISRTTSNTTLGIKMSHEIYSVCTTKLRIFKLMSQMK